MCLHSPRLHTLVIFTSSVPTLGATLLDHNMAKTLQQLLVVVLAVVLTVAVTVILTIVLVRRLCARIIVL